MSLLQNSNAVTPSAGYDIEKSCRFYNGHLSKTFSGAGNRDKWTISVWLKNNGGKTSGSDGLNGIFYSQTDNTHKTAIWNHGGGYALWNMTSAGNTAGGYLGPSASLRDPAAWYHLVFVWDSGNVTANDRIIIYRNGVRETAFADDVDPPINQDSYINMAAAHQIGYYLAESGASYNPNCYFSEYYFLDGQAEPASSFGEESTSGQWVPKDCKDDLTFGTNGFFLEFKNAAALGADTSGNSNDFAVNGIASHDQVVDTPTTNIVGLNSLTNNEISPLPEMNCWFENTGQGGTNWQGIQGTIALPNSGKWYFEWLCYQSDWSGGGTWGNLYGACGVIDNNLTQNSTDNMNSLYGVSDVGWGMNNGDSGMSRYTSNPDLVAGAPIIYQFAIDMDTRSLTCSSDGNGNYASVVTLPAGGTFTPGAVCYPNNKYAFNGGADSSFGGKKTAQGNMDENDIGDFYYTPPAGYLCLCAANLPTPSIALPGEHFNTKLFTGNNTTANAQTGVGFLPDFIWFKQYNVTRSHALFDSVRGRASGLASQDIAVATTSAATKDLASFDSDGFTVGVVENWSSTNTSGGSIVAWNWKAGGAPTATNSAGAGNVPTAGSVKINGSNLGSALAGDIPVLKLSANTTNGFSIGTYTGNGTANSTVAHGLSQGPELVIVKCYDGLTFDWTVGSTSMDAWTDYQHLNKLDARVDDVDFWRDTAPSASVITIGSNGNVNYNNDDFIFYAWHSVEGYSKVGGYTSNNNSDGPFVYTGFTPAWLMVKSSTGGNYDTWTIIDTKRDTYNVVDTWLTANGSCQENYSSNTGGSCISRGDIDIADLNSNGFKFRSSSGEANGGTTAYLYLAFAESPFKTSTGR